MKIDRQKKIWITFIGFSIMLIGMQLNNFVMAANDGKMPVKNFEKENKYPLFALHKELNEKTKYPYLADIINIGPAIFSLGDLVMLVGIIPFLIGLFLREKIDYSPQTGECGKRSFEPVSLQPHAQLRLSEDNKKGEGSHEI